MAGQKPAQIQPTGAIVIPHDLSRQLNILRTEHLETVRESREMKEKLDAALRENMRFEKDKKRVKNAVQGEDGVRKLDAECRNLQKEKQALVARNGMLKADLKRSEKCLASEQKRRQQLSTQVSRLETVSQVDRKKIQTLVRQIELRDYKLKTKDSEIQTLDSKLKKAVDAQKKLSLQHRKSHQEVKCGARVETQREISMMEADTEIERGILNTRYQPPLGQQSASNARVTRPNRGSATQYQEQEQQKPTTGDEPKKTDWTFRMTADEYSGAEVVSQVEKLNSEMLQVAASMADELDLENQMKGGAGSDNIIEAITRTANIIGPYLTSMLATSNSQYVNIVMQTAIQTALLLHTQRIICSWWLWDGNADSLLRNIHKRLYESEPQPVSARWRQLTRSYLRTVKRINEHELLQYLTDSLANIVIATGYSLNQATVKEGFMRFSHHLGEIIKLALQVNAMIGEGITSCDLEITFVPHSSPYDPNYMESVYSGTSPIHEKEPVICTVDLGLMKKERLSKPEVHTKELVLLKPKVLLPSVFGKI